MVDQTRAGSVRQTNRASRSAPIAAPANVEGLRTRFLVVGVGSWAFESRGSGAADSAVKPTSKVADARFQAD
jgi:hypothetical protein